MTEFSHPGEVRHFVHKRLFGAAKGFVTGGPGGALGGFLGAGSKPRQSGRLTRFGLTEVRRPGVGRLSTRSVVPRPGLRAAVQRIVPGGRTGLMVAGSPSGNGCAQGFHPNKSDYYTKAGFVAEGSKCVKNRRRNLSNGRANTKALRRMSAWDKQERKLGKTMKAIARGR